MSNNEDIISQLSAYMYGSRSIPSAWRRTGIRAFGTSEFCKLCYDIRSPLVTPKDSQGYALVDVDEGMSQGTGERSISVTLLQERFVAGRWTCVTEESARRRSVGLVFRIRAIASNLRHLHPRREMTGELVSALCDPAIARHGECIASIPYQC